MGNYTAEEQQPDKDLGRSLKPGWRNIADGPGGPDRLFGVPSIRKDIPAPRLRGVADHQNYGDESGAETILYPPRFTDEGVEQADFLYARNKEEIRDIFQSAGFELTAQEFEQIYQKARRASAPAPAPAPAPVRVHRAALPSRAPPRAARWPRVP